MHPELRRFRSCFIGTVILTQIPVVFIAFVPMPIGLDRRTGEPAQTNLTLRHMT